MLFYNYIPAPSRETEEYMTQMSLSPFEAAMNAGLKAREQDAGIAGHSLAIAHFTNALILASTDEERAAADGAAGVSHRVIGQFDRAEACFVDALTQSEDPELIARIQRDLGELYHERALQHLGADQLDKAEECFNMAEGLLNDSIESFTALGNVAEENASLGFLGMLLFNKGEVTSGRKTLFDADMALATLSPAHSVYATNTLIRRMRAASSIERLVLLPRALRYTSTGSASHGSRKRVYAAFLGNRVYRHLMERSRNN